MGVSITEYARIVDPDEYVSELVRGGVVHEPRPAWLHGTMAIRLIHILSGYLHAHPIGVLTTESGYILAREPATVRGPDVAFVRNERLPKGHANGSFFDGAPDLAIEIVSPGNGGAGMQERVFDFLSAGALAVWVVYPAARRIICYHAQREMRVFEAGDVLDGGDVLPGFSLDLSAFFNAG